MTCRASNSHDAYNHETRYCTVALAFVVAAVFVFAVAFGVVAVFVVALAFGVVVTVVGAVAVAFVFVAGITLQAW